MNFEIAPKETEKQVTFDEAVMYCLSLGNGWRLPTLKELQEITRISINYVDESGEIIHIPQHNFEKKWYWSSDEYKYNTERRWCFNYYTNTMFDCDKNTNRYLVRAVRDI